MNTALLYPYSIQVITGFLILIVLFTRFLPFAFRSFFERSPRLQKVGNLLPGPLMLLLVFYAFRDTPLTLPPHGLPELTCLSLTVLVHLWKRNLLLSLLPSTGLYLVMLTYWR